ncbi:CHAT domain-containing protein [Streptosporangium sp. NPDC051023]|uniref:CHAT domain-containing protein n=1 Tax=Streptosporangium sp. NPDC051023 TaxID=3155410 RepID=UPI00344C9EA9
MKLREAFPGAHAVAPDIPAWDMNLDLTSPRGIDAITDHLCEVISVAYQAGMVKFDACASLIIKEVMHLAQQHTEGDLLPGIFTLKLAVASTMATHWNGAGNPERAWHWTALALGSLDANEKEATVFPEIVAALAGSATTAPVAIPALLEITETLYYLAWSRGYHREFAVSLHGILWPICKQMMDFGDVAVPAAIQLAGWQAINGHKKEAGELVAILERKLYDDPSGHMATRIAACLTTRISTLSSRNAVEHAEWALANVPNIPPRERITLLAAHRPGDVDSIVERLGDIRATLQEMVRDLSEFQPDRLERSHLLTQAFNTISPIVYPLLSQGYVKEAQLLLAEWRGVGPDNSRVSPSAFVVPTETGAQLSMPGAPMCSLSSVTLNRLTLAINFAFGSALADQQDQTFTLDSPAVGRVNHSSAQEFQEAVYEYVRPDLIAEKLSFSPQSKAIVSLVSPRVPLQALIAKQGGAVLPISVSNTEPSQDRYPSRIQFWCGDVHLAETELEMVSHVLGWTGEVDIVRGDSISRDNFLESYMSDTYDIIWVASHGGQPHYKPMEASLYLSDGVTVALRDLVNVDKAFSNERRLLVLNTCDSGAAAHYGVLAEVGLAHWLARSDQAVIANLWPVSTYSACIFGGLLAAGIAGGQSYFDSFSWALELIGKGREEIADAISGFGPPISFTDVLHEFSDPTILQWGAPAFFE